MARVTRASYAVLAACTIAHFMNHIYTGALSPILPVISEELSLNFTEAGIITSAIIVSMTIAHLFFGYFTDKGGRDAFISISVLVSAIVLLFSSLATTFIILATTMVLLGLGAAPYHPAAFPALDERFERNDMAKATGLQAAGGLVGMALIPVIGVSLYTFLGSWRTSLSVLGILGVILFIPTFLLMRHSSKSTEEIDNKTEDCVNPEGWSKHFILTVILAGMRGIPFRSLTLMMPLYLYEAYSLDPFLAGVFTTIFLSAGLFGELVSATVSDRSGKRVPYILVSSTVVIPLFIMMTLALETILLVLVLIGLGFFFFFGVPPMQAFQTEVCPRDSKGLAFGIFFSVGAIPGALAPVMFGYIGDTYGLGMSMVFLAVVAVIATVLGLALRSTPSEKATS
jgi:FSR family fosmidomycin resistance protein-like MFS transporter